MTNGFDKLLRESLTADAAADHGAECLDAALVAGWFDGTLSHAERTAVEAHAASCSRCQATIAALVRTDRPSPRVWWRAPAVRWLVPMAVASAAVLVVWIGVRRPDTATVPPAAATSARLESPAPAPTVLPGSKAAERGSSPGPASAAAAEKPPAAAGARGKVSDSARRDQDAKAIGLPVEAANAESRSAFAPRIEPLRQQAGTAVQLPQAPEPQTPDASPGPLPGGRAGALASPPAAPRASEPITAPLTDAAGESRARGVAQSVGAGAGRDGGRMPLIQSPDRSVRWRITGQSQVERSIDGGLTWQTQTTGVNAVLIAGIAPSTNVCWLVGWRGVVLKTTDGGQTWTRVAFPEEINLMAVVADDDKVATVTAAGGRQLHTTDGGTTWR
jgi:Photosynthesis system II assembly factor YCF48/Putative zinc-finger